MVRETVYIAGPMRGIPLFNFPAFDRAAELLRSLGHVPINPADFDRHEGFDPTSLPADFDWRDLDAIGFNLREAAERDLVAIVQAATAILLLPGWERSKGARAERAVAEWLGLRIFTQVDFPEVTCGF